MDSYEEECDDHETTKLDSWLYDVRLRLERALESNKHDLRDGDKGERQRAAGKIAAILDELFPPKSDAERQQIAENVMGDESLTPAEKLAQADAILHPKRKRGRPATDTKRQAICALSMHNTRQGDWRTIALKVRGCCHFGRSETKSCKSCGDAIAQSVRRLERLLRRLGLEPMPEKSVKERGQTGT